MATVTYNGRMAYTEVTWSGVTYGFSREMTRDDIPDDLVEYLLLDTSTTWLASKGASPQEVEKTVKMVEVIEVDDSTSDESPFNPNWTRGEMIKWFSARGISTKNTATKASLTAKAEALTNPSDGDE